MNSSRNIITIMSLMAVLATGSVAQQCLSTPLVGGNAANGAMFDVSATGADNVIVTDFSVCFTAPLGEAVNYELYVVTNGSSHVGKETTSSSWTLMRTGTAISTGQGLSTPLNCNIGVLLFPGMSQGFYITTTDPTQTVSISPGSVLGNPIVTSGDLTIHEGSSANYPFTAVATPRAFNGTVHYTLAGVPAEYQVNTDHSRLTVNGVETQGCTPAITTLCASGPMNLKYRSIALNQPFELAVTGTPALGASQGAQVSVSGNQTINLDFTGEFVFMNGGTNFRFLPILGDWDLNTVAPSIPDTLTFQAFHFSPSALEGYQMSQAAQTDTIYAGPVAGPSLEDGVTSIDLTQAPLCFTPGSVDFLGTSYNTIHVAANGRVLFGDYDADATPSVAEALLDAPFIGAWANFSPVTAGAIQVVATGNGLRIEWQGVPVFGAAGGKENNWAIEYDGTDSRWRITGLDSIDAAPSQMFLGMSPGVTGQATDPGTVSYTNYGGSVLTSSDMIYEFGTVGSLAQGLSALTFIPDGLGNYVWLAN